MRGKYTDDELVNIIVQRELNFARARRQWANRPLAVPGGTAEQRAEWRDQEDLAYERGLFPRINAEYKARARLPL